jgi:hypothetical protein
MWAFQTSRLGKRAVLVEWQTFPDQAIDPALVYTNFAAVKTLVVRVGFESG